MELLNPSCPAHIAPYVVDRIYGFSSSTAFVQGFDQKMTPTCLPEEVRRGGCSGDFVVHVAVGKTMDRDLSLLQWTFTRFGDKEICLLHIHQPSPVIPTLLGKLPVSQANKDVVSHFRKKEWEQTKKLLNYYLDFCTRAKVKTSFVTAEADQVQKGIVDLVNTHGITKLVMGTLRSVPDNCMKVKVKNSSKANYAARYAPLPCEIWFINKGRHVWTRKSAQGPSTSSPSWTQPEILPSEISVSTLNNSIQPESPTSSRNEICLLHSQLKEARVQTKESVNDAISELFKRRKSELEAIGTMKKLIHVKTSHVNEVKLQNEVSEALKASVHEQEKLLEQREEVRKELQKTIQNVALLGSRLQEVNLRFNEAAGELELVQESISSLRQEKEKIQKQKMEALSWLQKWRTEQVGSSNYHNGFVGFVEELPQLSEFSLSELETATCNFSESFKISQDGYGSVYKGELSSRTVAIRKLNPHNMQGPSEFQEEVQVLVKLQHPHLVTLLGVCPEAWALVYEYMPNGSLQSQLFQKVNTPPLTWKTRARIIAEIASALYFLHCTKPEGVFHGDLKLESILLDSELRSKICDFGICRLVSEETLHCPSFRRSTEPKGAFSYTDPEFQRTGVMTTKSDIYSFGLIILQLLTAKPTIGLVGEVRKVVSSGHVSSVLDFSGGDWPEQVVRKLIDVGLQCCELIGRGRLELTPALVRELQQLYVLEENPIPPYFLCPILQEIMHDPQIAADGFTYEGEAMREWLENGHETSPMTNLKLNHLQLTSNHTLRLAIQEWLFKS